jgi:hypothetical protein
MGEADRDSERPMGRGWIETQIIEWADLEEAGHALKWRGLDSDMAGHANRNKAGTGGPREVGRAKRTGYPGELRRAGLGWLKAVVQGRRASRARLRKAGRNRRPEACLKIKA